MAVFTVSGRLPYGFGFTGVPKDASTDGISGALDMMVCGRGMKNWKDLSSDPRLSWIACGVILLVTRRYLMFSSRWFAGTLTLVAFSPEVNTNA